MNWAEDRISGLKGTTEDLDQISREYEKIERTEKEQAGNVGQED